MLIDVIVTNIVKKHHIDGNKYEKAFHTLIHSNIVPLSKRLSLTYVNKKVKHHTNKHHVLEDGLNTIRERIKHIEDTHIIVEPFKPTKTALHAISFLNNDNIQELKMSEEPYVKNIFSILNIVNEINDNSEHLISNFLNKNKHLCKNFIKQPHI